ncbi:MAG: secondary thiamine-phosphate synthase enzyme YjbQ [Pseudomonadota bacterium]
MHQIVDQVEIETPGPGLIDITGRVSGWLRGHSPSDGLLTCMVRHTSCSLTIQENADPDVLRDLQDAMAGLAPHGGRERYRHASEGPDDMAAHIRTVLSGVTLSIPVQSGRMMLGTWQGIYLWEHRDRGRARTVALHLLQNAGGPV